MAGVLGHLRADIRSLIRDVQDVSGRIRAFKATTRNSEERAEFARWLLECQSELRARGRVLELLIDEQLQDEKERERLRALLRRALK
jgi:hypothetical protein